MTDPRAYVPGLANVPAAESSVCYLDGSIGKLQYRGYPIEVLSEKATFEEVAYLLLNGELPTQEQLDAFDAELIEARDVKFRIIDLLKTLPESGHPMDALAASVAAMSMFYPGDHVEDAAFRSACATRLTAKFPTVVAAWQRIRNGDDAIKSRPDLGHAANFLYMLSGKEPDPLIARTLDVALTLHAEHQMNASTFSARVTGSALADAYAVATSAVGTLSGPLHGGANEEVLKMLRTIPNASPGAVRAWAEDRLARKQKISGFGHREYKVKDPRATILQRLSTQVFQEYGSTPLYDVALELETQMEELVGQKGIYPNVDFYSGILYDKMGIPTDLFTPIFAIARISGWLAHWLEQLQHNRIFRPSQIWNGQADRDFVPMSDRRGE
ncbi:MAG: citrate synthase [Myxococcales bacterium]|nr:citrate synthase [Myxococcales bacterium]